ncbi:MAG TPA: aldehyde ferredoxin oxidoreductase C-terminal domain-containing protein [bacterium]|nr:aldehyde ferredoxin oxidoreductase C-terminal domain-containing protein [bacterium]
MRIVNGSATPQPADVLYRRCTIDLGSGAVRIEEVPCANLEDVLGGFGRSFQMLAQREIKAAYVPENRLIVNTGLLTGTDVMTGLRTYFSAYSPLKVSSKGLPSAMWSAGSGKFGSKLKWAGLDEVIFEGRSATPVYAVLSEGPDGPRAELKPADALRGLDTHEKIMHLAGDYPDAHFAVIGQAGEAYENCYMAAVAMSTENQLKSHDDKCRYAGRGGMGSMMGYKNLLGIVAQAKDKLGKLTPDLRDLNRAIATGPGSAKFRETGKGGTGGTWSNYEPLHKVHVVPELNFRPRGDDQPVKMMRPEIEKHFAIKAESCWRCGINCHKNVYERTPEGKPGKYLAKFDYEPVNLLSTNVGLEDGHEVADVIRLVDNLGMDSISIGTTVAYVLDYNQRHPDKPLFNGATFGQHAKIHELIDQTGRGKLPEIGHGVKRLSESLHEPGYAMQVKGLELPAYIPDTNPGYAWAIAGGHMSMATFMLLALQGDTSMDYWVDAITQKGLYQVRDDLLGSCKFAGMNHKMALTALKEVTGLDVTQDELLAATRRAFLRGLVLEQRQGYDDADYTLPAQVFEDPNPNLGVPSFLTPEFFSELKQRVWAVFRPEMEQLSA